MRLLGGGALLLLLLACCWGQTAGQRGRSRSRSTLRRPPRPGGTAPPPEQIECDLNKPDALSRCVKALLLDQRAEVARQAEPLDLPDKTFDKVRIWDGRLDGLSCYEVDDLALTFPEPGRLAVDVTLSWSDLRAVISARAKDCKKFIVRVCASVTARPMVKVARTVGRLRTTLAVGITADGNLTVTPSGTDVDVQFAGVDVAANIQSPVGKFFNRVFGDPASPVVRALALRHWRRQRDELQRTAAESLDRAIVTNLAVSLQRLLAPDAAKTGAAASRTSAFRPRSGACRIHPDPDRGQLSGAGKTRVRVQGPRRG